MPNWVYNTISVSGTKEDIEAFVAKATAVHPETFDEATGKVVYTTEPAFSFWNFVAPPDEAVETGVYFGIHGYADGKAVGDTPDNWYNFQCDQWGTKWDACDVDLSFTDENSVHISYNTAWSIPTPVMGAMVEQHPELTFEFWCEEEQGWGAEFTGEAGEMSLTKEWDIPSSHSDYVERDNEDGCVCSWSDDTDDWFGDCPRPEQDFYVVVTKTYRVTTHTAENAWELAQDNDPDEQMELIEDETTIFVKNEDGLRIYPMATDGVE
jgi:hypothetical protein